MCLLTTNMWDWGWRVMSDKGKSSCTVRNKEYWPSALTKTSTFLCIVLEMKTELQSSATANFTPTSSSSWRLCFSSPLEPIRTRWNRPSFSFKASISLLGQDFTPWIVPPAVGNLFVALNVDEFQECSEMSPFMWPNKSLPSASKSTAKIWDSVEMFCTKESSEPDD